MSPKGVNSYLAVRPGPSGRSAFCCPYPAFGRLGLRDRRSPKRSLSLSDQRQHRRERACGPHSPLEPFAAYQPLRFRCWAARWASRLSQLISTGIMAFSMARAFWAALTRSRAFRTFLSSIQT
uniref:Uncharacterized protein n=1 Tax=Podoviridae sp. ctRnx2 TaxID=2826555 RepID=A0A8S5QS70_9CAUD|nr:MAG TPA: hypothetical protein [Podoviridae sp. ctRnx2]